MPFAITGQRGDQPIAFVQQMLGLPAGVRADAATVFQCAEERMAQKRLVLGTSASQVAGAISGQVCRRCNGINILSHLGVKAREYRLSPPLHTLKSPTGSINSSRTLHRHRHDIIRHCSVINHRDTAPVFRAPGSTGHCFPSSSSVVPWMVQPSLIFGD
jgi:hypothetical protein